MRIALITALAFTANPLASCPAGLPAGASEVPATEPSGETTWTAVDDTAMPDTPDPDPGLISCGETVEGSTMSALAAARLDAYRCNVGNYDAPERVFEFHTAFYGSATASLVNPKPSVVDHDVMILGPYGCDAWGSNAVEFDVIPGDVLRVVVDGYDDDAGEFALKLECDPIDFTPPTPGGCAEYLSSEAEGAPVQTALPLPSAAQARDWEAPTFWTSHVAFAGEDGHAATHEGIDYIHADEDVAVVPVGAASDGVVAYVRTGCPQSSPFGHNDVSRECGAGWGNHVVVEHGDGLYTRYAHLDPADVAVRVGAPLDRGQVLGGMGNSGRSETRHLHFEVGSKADLFEPCEASQSFDAVHDPAPLL